MDDRISVHDLITYYRGTLCEVNGKLAYIIKIAENYTFYGRFIETGEEFKLRYDDIDIRAVDRRLGMINYNGVCWYLSRRSVRRYQIGIDGGNVRAGVLEGIEYRNNGINDALMKKFDIPEVAKMLNGNYPSFKECLDHVKVFGGVLAFDRQFAISETRDIYYKTSVVGRLPRMCSSPEHIVFNEGFEYLSCVLNEVTHDKIVRSIAA